MSEEPKSSGRVPHQNVNFESNGAQSHGYLQLPPSGSGPGLIVIQEWWGLDDHIADVTRRFAAEGFVAFAPDLFGGNIAHDAAEAQRMMTELPVERGVQLLTGAVDYLIERPEVTTSTVGAVGFCMGGGFVIALAAAEPRVTAAVPFYGVLRQMPDFSNFKAQVLGHYGEKDTTVPPDSLDDLRTALKEQAGIEADLRLYPAGHAFFNDQRPTYHAESAHSAWESTLAFLHDNVD